MSAVAARARSAPPWSLLVSVALSAVLLALAVRDVDWGRMVDTPR